MLIWTYRVKEKRKLLKVLVKEPLLRKTGRDEMETQDVRISAGKVRLRFALDKEPSY